MRLRWGLGTHLLTYSRTHTYSHVLTDGAAGAEEPSLSSVLMDQAGTAVLRSNTFLRSFITWQHQNATISLTTLSLVSHRIDSMLILPRHARPGQQGRGVQNKREFEVIISLNAKQGHDCLRRCWRGTAADKRGRCGSDALDY